MRTMYRRATEREKAAFLLVARTVRRTRPQLSRRGLESVVLPTGTIASLYGVHFLSDQVGFAVGSFNMILKTTDGGQTWRQVSDGEVIVRDPSGKPNI